MKFDETLHMCAKLSGVAASYSTKEKFDSIMHFLSKRFVFMQKDAGFYLYLCVELAMQAVQCSGGRENRTACCYCNAMEAGRRR